MILMKNDSIDDISRYEEENKRITIEGECCDNLCTNLEVKKAVDKGDEDMTVDSIIEKLLNESLNEYSLLLNRYTGKRDNRKLTIKATELLYKYALYNRYSCTITGEEVSIRATYKQIQDFSLLIKDYIGDNTTIFRDLKVAVALRIISIDKNSKKRDGTLWRLPKASTDSIIGKLETLNIESQNGAKIGNICLSQTQMTFGKKVVCDSYIDETLGKKITRDEFERLLKKVKAFTDNQKIVAEMLIMNSLSHEEQLTFLSCRSKVCQALKIERVKYSKVKKDCLINQEIHGNTIVFIRK
jgi:hypothetical protein